MAQGLDLAKRKICFLAGTLGQGGAEQQLLYMLQGLTRCGAMPRVLCLTQGEFCEERIRKLGVPVKWVGQHQSRALRLRRIAGELFRDRPQVIQSQHFYTNLYAALAGKLLGVPAIGAIRSDVVSEIRGNGVVLGTLSLRMPRTIVANSATAISAAMQRGVRARRLLLLPNVVDTERFCPAPRHAAPGVVRVLSVGRLVAEKRHDRLLRVLGRLCQLASTPWVAVMVGAGPLAGQLRQQAEALGLAGRVFLRGAAEDTVTSYQQADLFILVSDHEGAPNVVLEAMACGLPVVATRVGGMPDLVQHGCTGYLVNPPGEEELARRLAELIDNPNLRHAFGMAAREKVLAQHSLARLPERLAGLYSEILGPGRLQPVSPLQLARFSQKLRD